MKKIILPALSLLLLWVNPAKVIAQSVGINADGSVPHTSAILDIKSTGKGLLMPRMTSTQRNAIATPANGLLVFDTDTNSFWYYSSTVWMNLASGWSLSGNIGTNPATHFLGTSDNTSLIVKINNELSGQVNPSGNWNTGWGLRTLMNNTTGNDNTAIGAESLFANTTGGQNTGLGAGALKANTTGEGNVAVGQLSMYNSTTGSFNIAVGIQALINNTTGSWNTAVGTGTLPNNSIGDYNTGLGGNALFNNTTGINNTASGFQALNQNTTGSDNTAFGINALHNNTTAAHNTAAGSGALYSNTTGINNTATGEAALYYNISGSNNTATGLYSMLGNTTGQFNTAVGFQALGTNTTGNINIAIGANALAGNTTGAENTSIGAESMYFTTTGIQNTALGKGALLSNEGGNSNTGIGFGADVAGLNFINATALGYKAVVNASNKIRIGNSAVTAIEGQVPFTSPSDGRFKFNVQEDVKGLDFILQLRPVTYQFDTKKFDASLRNKTASQKDPGDDLMQASYNKASAIRRTGFIAQEVEQAATKSNYNFSGLVKPQSSNDHYSLSYESFVVPLVKAVQEQQRIIDNQEKEMKDLLRRIEILEKDQSNKTKIK
jgi:hypothetical protein